MLCMPPADRVCRPMPTENGMHSMPYGTLTKPDGLFIVGTSVRANVESHEGRQRDLSNDRTTPENEKRTKPVLVGHAMHAACGPRLQTDSNRNRHAQRALRDFSALAAKSDHR